MWEGFYTYYNYTKEGIPTDSGNNGRNCWNENCGVGGTWTDDQCTAGIPIYQHGPGEGLTDVIEACAMDSVGKDYFSLWWPFVYCFEGIKLENAYPGLAYGAALNQSEFEHMFGVKSGSFNYAINFTMQAAQECATVTGLNWTFIESCASPSPRDGALDFGPRGEALEAANALATVKLNPEHVYTPWIVFQGSPLWFADDDVTGPVGLNGGTDLLNWICNAYKGKLPPGCPSDPYPVPAAMHDEPTDD